MRSDRNDPNRPYDWQDITVIAASVIASLMFLALLFDGACNYGLR